MFYSKLFKISGRVHSKELNNAVDNLVVFAWYDRIPDCIPTPHIHFWLECLVSRSKLGFRANIQQRWKLSVFDIFRVLFF